MPGRNGNRVLEREENEDYNHGSRVPRHVSGKCHRGNPSNEKESLVQQLQSKHRGEAHWKPKTHSPDPPSGAVAGGESY